MADPVDRIEKFDQFKLILITWSDQLYPNLICLTWCDQLDKQITLGNKDFGAMDILTDSSCLGSQHTQMNTCLAQSGQIFPQIRLF